MVKTFAENVVETSNTLGTNAYELAGAVLGFRTFAAAGFVTGDKPYYVVRNRQNSKYEFNKNAVFTEGVIDTLARGTYLSTNVNNPVVWAENDRPLTIYIPTPGEAVDAALQSIRLVGSLWVPNRRRVYVDKGAIDYTVLTDDADLVLQFNTSAAKRTVNLPNIADVPMGFVVGIVTTSQAFPIVLNPGATDSIDGLGDNVNLEVNVPYEFEVRSDGSNWRTNLRGEYYNQEISFSGANSTTSGILPSSIRTLEGYFRITDLATDNVILEMRTAGADGVIDTGASDYHWQIFQNVSNSATGSGVSSTGAAFINLGGSQDNAELIPMSMDFTIMGVSDAVPTVMTYQSRYLDSAGIIHYSSFGSGTRAENAPVTAVQFLMSSGNMAGNWRMIGRR